MEKFIYEAKPYIYGLVSIVALYNGKGSVLMTASGLVMGLACISIGMLRHDSRTMAYGAPRKGKALHKQIHGETHINGQKRFSID